MTLQDFFIESLSFKDEKQMHPSIVYSKMSSDFNTDLPLPAKPLPTYHQQNNFPFDESNFILQYSQRTSYRPGKLFSI